MVKVAGHVQAADPVPLRWDTGHVTVRGPFLCRGSSLGEGVGILQLLGSI